MTDIAYFISGALFGLWAFIFVYKIGRKHGIVIGRVQLAKELSEKIDADCRKSYEMGYSRGHIDYIRGKTNYYG